MKNPDSKSVNRSTIIRPARIDDTSDIAFVHVNSWREVYTGIVPQAYLDNLHYDYYRRKSFWDQFIRDERGRSLHVAEYAGKHIVGFSSVSPGRDKGYEDWGELTCIYLLKKFQGYGSGSKLLHAAFKGLIEQGFTRAYCWVLEGNPTIDFYKNTGGLLTSRKQTDEIGGKELTEVAVEWVDLDRFAIPREPTPMPPRQNVPSG